MKSPGKYLKTLLVLSILLNLLLGYKVIKEKYFRYNPDLTYDRKSLFNYLKMDSNSIVFVGNSLTRQFELAELFNNLAIRNRGINGDNSLGILNRLQKVIEAKPRKIFLENGINDVLSNVPKEKILEDYEKILNKLQLECKTSKLYVESLLPVYKKGLAIVNNPIKNETVKEINKSLQAYCVSHDITFINLYDKFELNGEMNPKFCIADGLHISGEGYLLLTELLQPYVNGL